MPKFNYLRNLIDSISEKSLRSLVEEYAQKDTLFEAFLIKHSGAKVDTGKDYLEYFEELEKLLKKCTTRKGFVKVTRFKNAGVESFRELMLSHFQNENFKTSLWMSLALFEIMHRAVLMNTRYQSYQKPFKVFEKILEESRGIFNSCMTIIEPDRKQRPEIFKAMLRCWWKERERPFTKMYFSSETLFQYCTRDEDLMTLQLCIHQLRPRALEIDRKSKKNFWKGWISTEKTLEITLLDLEKMAHKKLNEW